MLEIVELILYFNQLNQSGKGLKILTLNQMLSRLPISLAQLKAGNNSGKSKIKIRQIYILCTNQKILQKMSINVWLTLFKHGNNLYDTGNRKTNEFNKFIYQFTDKLNLKTPNDKNIGLVNLSI